MKTGLNSPQEVYFFTKTPDQYAVPDVSSSEITNAQESSLKHAKFNARSRARFEMVDFRKPEVDVQGKQYVYIVRSNDSRERFKTVMSQSAHKAP
jgi:hypothetical protein